MTPKQATSFLHAIVLSFPLNIRTITPKLIEDIDRINFVSSMDAFGSNMKLASSSSTRVKLYLPNFSENGFSTAFSVAGNMPAERLARSINLYGLAASLKQFYFVHYIANSHLVVVICVEPLKEAPNYLDAVSSLNDLNKFLRLSV